MWSLTNYLYLNGVLTTLPLLLGNGVASGVLAALADWSPGVALGVGDGGGTTGGTDGSSGIPVGAGGTGLSPGVV